MIPTSIFPNLKLSYPNYSIKAIPEAWKADFGWTVNIHTKLPVLSQLRVLKEEDFTEVSLLLEHSRTKEELSIEWEIKDLHFCRPAKRIRRFTNAFLL